VQKQTIHGKSVEVDERGGSCHLSDTAKTPIPVISPAVHKDNNAKNENVAEKKQK
jgi:hypothetical protein